MSELQELFGVQPQPQRPQLTIWDRLRRRGCMYTSGLACLQLSLLTQLARVMPPLLPVARYPGMGVRRDRIAGLGMVNPWRPTTVNNSGRASQNHRHSTGSMGRSGAITADWY